MGYRLNGLDEPTFIAVSKPLLTEFGIHHTLESCALNRLFLHHCIDHCGHQPFSQCIQKNPCLDFFFDFLLLENSTPNGIPRSLKSNFMNMLYFDAFSVPPTTASTGPTVRWTCTWGGSARRVAWPSATPLAWKLSASSQSHSAKPSGTRRKRKRRPAKVTNYSYTAYYHKSSNWCTTDGSLAGHELIKMIPIKHPTTIDNQTYLVVLFF